MQTDLIKHQVEAQEWLEPVADAIQGATKAAFDAAGSAKKPIEDVLNGVYTGHPLHPAVTDVPLGAWTVVAALDAVEAATGRTGPRPRRGRRARDRACRGVRRRRDWAGAVLPAQGKKHQARRRGACGPQCRRDGPLRGLARPAQKWQPDGGAHVTGWMGYGVVSAAAYLGGSLVYDQRVGVDHAPRLKLPTEFTPVLPASHLVEASPTKAKVGDIPLVLVRRGERIFALADACNHLGGPLSEGKLEGDCITCPWHGSVFNLDGRRRHPRPGDPAAARLRDTRQRWSNRSARRHRHCPPNAP